jgi:hypothetical protein
VNPAMQNYSNIEFPRKNINFAKITSNGLPIIGKIYEKGDVLVGKVIKQVKTN